MDTKSLFTKVFSIRIISNEILKYCGANELKCLRKTNKLLREVVTDSEAYSTNCRVIIGMGTVSHGVMREISWKNATVDLSLNNKGIVESLDVLQTIQDLKFTVKNYTSVPHVIETMLTVLPRVPVLKILRIELEIFDVNLKRTFRNEQIKGIIENLEELQIFACDEDLEVGAFAPTYDLRGGPISRNFRRLSKMDLHFKSFQMPLVNLLGGTIVLKYIPYVLRACENTLEDVSLFDDVWSYGWMNTIICDNLKKLHVKSDNMYGRRVSTFLYNHPKMQYLHIEMTNGFSDRILQALTKISSNLTTLNLITRDLDFWLDEDDFDFLKRIDSLENFSFTQPRLVSKPPVIPGLAFVMLTNLPQHIKKLELQGIEDIWKQGQIDGYPITFDLKKKLLSPFKLLKDLSLMDSPNSVDDETLEFISQEFKELKTLKFSHCENVTAHGIIKINKGLNRLETLEIKLCTSLNMDVLSKLLQLPRLQILSALNMDFANQRHMNQIASNNPNLRSVTFHVTDEPDSYDFTALKQELQVYAPQLISVKNWVNSN